MGLIIDPYRFGYFAQGVTFDGTNDYMARGADLTSNADSKSGLLSCWIRWNGGDGSQQRIYYTQGGAGRITKLSTNKVRLAFPDSGLTDRIVLETNTAYTAGATWRHYLYAWDVATTVGQCYVNDASDLAAGSTNANNTLDYTRTNHFIGADDSGAEKINADIAEFAMWFGATLDISNSTNRRLFISAAGKPVDLGTTGTNPGIGQPNILFRGPASAFNTNSGNGGNFTVTGTLTDAATSPSS